MNLTDWPAHYTKLLNVSRLMLENASRQDWDELTRLGTERTRLVATLPSQLPPLPEDSSRFISVTIQEILECDRKILERVQPWLQHAGKMLAAFGRAESAGSAGSVASSP